MTVRRGAPGPAAKRRRLDLELVARGLAESREKAQALILAGEVLVNGQPVTRPAHLVAPEATIEVRRPLRYVSRGGLKLEHALHTCGVAVEGLVVIDVGAATGGFTDCLLQHGARRVYAVDVGYGQLDWRLRQDPRVVVLERTNIRYLERLPELADAAVIDVSFISLALVLPAVERLLKPEGWILALVKPQFEAERAQVRKGVVRDPEVHRAVLRRICALAQARGWRISCLTPSPLLGPAGNREFFVHLTRTGPSLPVEEAIDRAVRTPPPSTA